ncbi:thioredoxin fold domain-containing protein [Hymenobacter taeanensis]|uniref:Thioredoxin fold domain-containing protein n=1 Tax=Hymenobacter taeanensis TaxID=2735321 RepID=A0A6M6BCH9_9BACT|nr:MULTISPECIES: cytochrome c biogenesis protein CcdA [Hymenobacter]QJX45926.1 thioredoxin fold domain-containing protein [Hymenobacter taeanensis]UOQ79772.1 thioredoxin family protein [Hymenobacter sp. 5414T-23]
MQLLKIFRLTVVLVLLSAYSTLAQVTTPTKLSTTVSKTDLKVGDEVELIVNARIQDTWHLYATNFDPDLGPTVFTFSFTKSPAYELVGTPKSVGAQKHYDDVFKGDVTYFEKTGVIKQRIRVLQPGSLTIKAEAEYQSCTDVDGRCIPGNDPLSFGPLEVTGVAIAPSATPASPSQGAQGTTTPAPATTAASATTAPQPATAATLSDTAAQAGTTPAVTADAAVVAPDATPQGAVASTVLQDTKPAGTGLSLWKYLLLAFGAGLVAVLMPCVYPMLPMTVSYFTNNSRSRSEAITKALVYGLSIVSIYTGVGVVLSLLFGADAANLISSHWLPNLLSFVIFIIFGMSFLGLFEINAPSSLVNKVDAQADKGGWSGLFFMAATLVLVSFSCTVPIVGSVAIAAATGELLRPTLGMLAFSTAFALPFFLFALFPTWLKSMPRSGGWLNTLKVVLGFVELGMAFKFLSSADLSYHWGLLPRPIFLAIWIVLAGLLGLYLLGKFRLSHDSETTHVSVPRLLMSAVAFSFMLYMVPGLFGAPLNGLSALVPPATRQDYAWLSANAAPVTATAGAMELCSTPRFAETLELPHNLSGYFTLQEALACARQQGKPVFVDFTGHNCGNCRVMEATVWSDPRVLKRLQNDFVLVALYADDKTELPPSQWYTSPRDQRVKKTIGEQNLDFQITRFNMNAQPYYALLDPSSTLEKPITLAPSVAYESDVTKFVAFLDAGVARYKQQAQAVAQQ